MTGSGGFPETPRGDPGTIADAARRLDLVANDLLATTARLGAASSNMDWSGFAQSDAELGALRTTMTGRSGGSLAKTTTEARGAEATRPPIRERIQDRRGVTVEVLDEAGSKMELNLPPGLKVIGHGLRHADLYAPYVGRTVQRVSEARQKVTLLLRRIGHR